MPWNEHSDLADKHSFLSPSKYHWLQYDDDKLRETYNGYLAVLRGTELHKFAKDAIRLGVPLERSDATLSMHVNDAIAYMMTPEVPLVYSSNCFGTADAISFRKGLLRIHDLKTGVTPASMLQLQIYAALYCLEYKKKPSKIDTELRIYQNNNVSVFNPDPVDTEQIMEKIIHHNALIEELKSGGMLRA